MFSGGRGRRMGLNGRLIIIIPGASTAHTYLVSFLSLLYEAVPASVVIYNQWQKRG